MIQIQEPKYPWAIVHMDWVTALPPGGDRSYNQCLVLADSRKNDTNFGGNDQKILCYGLEIKDSDGFTHDWCTLIPALEMTYKTSVHYSTGKTPEMLEKGWNPRLPYDTPKKDLVDIYPTASRFKIILDKARHNANRCMKDSFKYAKERWDQSHKPPDFKIGDLVLVSTLNFNNIKGPKN
ncbi:hypothetical protein O181_110675 [Austropuccinia psidii MF-1]|uniref:Uncharacterized protein n=1 Tax=Austropuccinia psidii MF-1 TaxID=1389203 RepID=A0A9Q3JWW6_9BASI|nr:hypothetical protein [Austropuccinia psidii MF-1]